MEDDFVARRLTEESRDGKIACVAALRLAEELGISPRDLGGVANRLGIKIRGCQLGCF